MTVEEIAGLDLGYAPPFSPVWDPVLIAARKAADASQPPAASTRLSRPAGCRRFGARRRVWPG